MRIIRLCNYFFITLLVTQSINAANQKPNYEFSSLNDSCYANKHCALFQAVGQSLLDEIAQDMSETVEDIIRECSVIVNDVQLIEKTLMYVNVLRSRAISRPLIDYSFFDFSSNSNKRTQ